MNATPGRGISPVGVLVAAFWAVAVLPATLLPMTDPDTFWHIRVGREIIERGSIPTVDTWSIVGAGRAWVSQDWLSNVATAGAHELGPTAVSVAYGLMATAAIAILWFAIRVRRPGIGPLPRVGWLTFGLVLAAPTLGARVQVVDLLLAAAVIWILWSYLVSRLARWLIALPILAGLWVNLHAGFPLLFLFGGAIVVGEALDRITSRRARGEPLTWGQQVRVLAALGASALALVLNPNGWAIYAYPFDTLEIAALAGFVGEWQPASLGAPSGQLLAAFVLIGVLPALALGWRTVRSADVLVMIGLVVMAVSAVRFLLVTGPIGAAIVCVVITGPLAGTRLGSRLGRVAARLGRPVGGARRIVNAALVLGVVVLGVVLVGLRVGPAGQASAVAAEYPVEAVRWLGNQPEQRVFNRYEWGGYLGLELPDRPIFIDGRADIYGDPLILEYVETISVNIDPQLTFDRHQIDAVLYPIESVLGTWLDDQDAWTRSYADETSAVWTRRGS